MLREGYLLKRIFRWGLSSTHFNSLARSRRITYWCAWAVLRCGPGAELEVSSMVDGSVFSAAFFEVSAMVDGSVFSAAFFEVSAMVDGSVFSADKVAGWECSTTLYEDVFCAGCGLAGRIVGNRNCRR